MGPVVVAQRTGSAYLGVLHVDSVLQSRYEMAEFPLLGSDLSQYVVIGLQCVSCCVAGSKQFFLG